MGAQVDVRVPEGHRVTVFEAAPEPALIECPGGVLIAHLGTGSDDAGAELDELIPRVRGALDRSRRGVLVSASATSLSQLFAPSDPSLVQSSGELGWVFGLGCLDAWAGDFERLFAGLLSAVPESRAGSVGVSAWFADGVDAHARALAQWLGRTRMVARRIDSEGRVLVEVERPEGVVISAFLGELWMSDAGAADTPRAPSARVPVTRAPRLGRLLLQAADAPRGAAWHALLEELLQREIPLLVIADAAGRVRPQHWPSFGPALAAYPDQQTFRWAVEDMGLPGPVGLAAMAPHAFFRWAAEAGMPVALNAYRHRGAPVYVSLHAAEVGQLAGREHRFARE